MTYKWKIPGIVPVDAQTAGEEIERIYNRDGFVDPAVLVMESKEESAPLHKCFEWNDTEAAKKYRITQAKEIVRSIVTVHETTNTEARAFVSVKQEYLPISVVIKQPDTREILLNQALNELRWFERKYSQLSELCGVIQEIRKVV